MRDAISFAHRNVPAVALVTTEFWPQGDFVARSAGMPTVPRIELPHPVAGSGHENMDVVARKIASTIVSTLWA